MKLQTDPEVVEKLAEERQEENWRFRCFLKTPDRDLEKLDAVVHRHYEHVARQIDCCACANCCRKASPTLLASDVERLASGLGLSEVEVKDRFLTPKEKGEGLVFNQEPCPLLSENRCSIYAHRPDDCRGFPHLHKEGIYWRLGQLLQNCSICPIVFNVYERLKEELWHPPVETWENGFDGEGLLDGE